MLNILIPGVDEGVASAADGLRVRELMQRERERLADPVHLVEHVIGSPAEFAWDFDVLQDGFLRLADPYLELPTGIGSFYLSLLRDLGADVPENHHGVLILEFMHLATRINDRFNFADELARQQPDLRVAESLVQLRYTAQFLNNYPRYTIIENRYGAAEDARIRLHRWGNNVFTTVGMSRAALLRWCHRGFADVPLDAYRQNAINTLCEYLMSPVCVAMILARVEDAVARQVRRAFSWLELGVKLLCEQRLIDGDIDVAEDSPLFDTTMPVTLPGYRLIEAGRQVDVTLEPGGRFAPVKRVWRDARDEARRLRGSPTSGLADEAWRAIDRFTADIAAAGVLQDTAARVVACLNRGGR